MLDIATFIQYNAATVNTYGLRLVAARKKSARGTVAILQMKMTTEEKALMRKAASYAGLPLSTWLRALGLEKARADLIAAMQHRPQ